MMHKMKKSQKQSRSKAKKSEIGKAEQAGQLKEPVYFVHPETTYRGCWFNCGYGACGVWFI